MNELAIISVLFVIISVLFSISVVLFFAEFFELRFSKAQTILLVIAVDIVGCVLAVTVLPVWAGLVETALAYFIISLIVYDFADHKVLYALLIPGFYVFIILSFICLFMAILALVFKIHSSFLLNDSMLYTLGALADFLLGLIVINIFRRSKKWIEGFAQMLENFLTTFFLTFVIWLIVVLSYLNAILFVLTPLSATSSGIFLLALIGFIGTFVLICSLSVRSSSETINTMKTQQIEKQMQSQMLHYKSYADYTRSIRKFREIYKDMMSNVYELMQKEEYPEAKREIDKINDLMADMIVVHKEYSNHALLDAVMQGVANQCADLDIKFNAKIYAPTSFGMSDTDLCQLFVDIMDVYIEIAKDYYSERNIKFTSNKKGDWILIKGECSTARDVSNDTIITDIKSELENSGAVVDDSYDPVKEMYGMNMAFRV